MILSRRPITDKDETAQEIYTLIEQFAVDLDAIFTPQPGGEIPVNQLPLTDYYSLVRAIPYRRDPVNPSREVVARPYYLFKHARLGLDCKKKCILMAAWLKRHFTETGKLQSAPYRLIGSSQRKDRKIHHIYPEVYISGQWRTVDATYPKYKLFEVKTDLTTSEVL